MLKAHSWLAPDSNYQKKVSFEISEEEREVRKVWVKEEIMNWEIKPSWRIKDPPLNEEELDELADNLVEAELLLEWGEGVPWVLQKNFRCISQRKKGR